MRLLITGATGLVGRHAARRAMDLGHRATVWVRNPNRLSPDIRDRATIVETALPLAKDRWSLLRDHDAVINCAGVLASANPQVFSDANALGAASLYAAAKAVGIPRFVHVSSIGVYGVPPDGRLSEESPEEPFPERRGRYTSSKLDGDLALRRASAEDGPQLCLVRPATVYGPGASFPWARLAKRLPGRIVVVGGGPKTLMPVVYAANLADALLAAAESDVTGPVNVVDDPSLTYRAWHGAARSVLDRPPRFVYVPVRALLRAARLADLAGASLGRRSHYMYQLQRNLLAVRVDGSRANQLLGYTPRFDLTETVRATLQVTSGTGP